MDVQLPDGTIVKNVPEGTTQSQLLARLKGANPQQPYNFEPNTPSMSAAPPLPFSATAAQVHEDYVAAEKQNPWIERGSTSRAALPLLGGLAGTLVGGPGIGGLVASSLVAGAGAGGGELMAQSLNREQINPKAAAIEGGKTAAGNFAGGLVLKGLGAAAKKLFSSPLDDAASAGAQFAQEKGVPFPLSSAAPGSKAATAQQASRALLPGEIKTQLDADKVAQFLNREVSTIQAEASPLDEAALKGQQFLRTVFEPGETIYTETFKNFRNVVGDATAVPLTNTTPAVQGVAEALKTRGATGALAQQLQTIAKRPSSQMTAQQLDALYGELLKKAGKNPNAIDEMNVVLSALAKDMDAVGQQFGVSFADDIVKAKATRDAYRGLREIPALERLAKDFGDRGGTLGSRQWMTELFGNPNGKALGELRARNPELYHELADSYLAGQLQRFSRPSDSLGQMLDGKALRTWFEQNQAQLKLIYGGPQAQALDNFTNYASLMSGAVKRAATGKGLDPTNLFPRAAAETGAAYLSPMLMVPSEAGSYVLAKGLSDPSSTLFRLFTQGVKPSTLKFLDVSAKMAGQKTAREVTKDADSR